MTITANYLSGCFAPVCCDKVQSKGRTVLLMRKDHCTTFLTVPIYYIL